LVLHGTARELWKFRGFIIESVRREFVARYTGTQLGVLWAVLQPLAMILIYTLVFANIMKPSLPGHSSQFAYSIYLCSGVLTWALFSEVLSRSASVFIHNANLLKKVNFPKIILPINIILSALLHYLIVMLLFMAFLFSINAFPGLVMFSAIPVVLLMIGFSVGLGIFCGTINVFYRDVEQTLGMILQFWFWLTPIVYANKSLPPEITELLRWNPMGAVIRSMQMIFLEQKQPEWTTLLYPAVISLVLLFLGFATFRRLSGEIVDQL
jgi:lipopolysaccharide transport system permease protein